MSHSRVWGRLKSEGAGEPKVSTLVQGTDEEPPGKCKKCWDWSAEKTATQPGPQGGQQSPEESRGKEKVETGRNKIK